MAFRRRLFFFIGIGCLFMLYLIIQLRFVILPPSLTVFSQIPQVLPAGEHSEIRGKTDNLSQVFINGTPIAVDRAGLFAQKVTIHHGINRIEVKAQNRFSRERSVYLTIIGEESSL